MKSRISKIFTAIVVVLAWSTSAYAGCTKPQISGEWETAFSSGDSCVLKISTQGIIVAASSVCFNPDLGATAPDSGKLPVKDSCLAEGNIVVQGLKIRLFMQVAADRSMAAGRYQIPSTGEKGSVVMVRLP